MSKKAETSLKASYSLIYVYVYFGFIVCVNPEVVTILLFTWNTQL